jgi:hypothetical protein
MRFTEARNDKPPGGRGLDATGERSYAWDG